MPRYFKLLAFAFVSSEICLNLTNAQPVRTSFPLFFYFGTDIFLFFLFSNFSISFSFYFSYLANLALVLFFYLAILALVLIFYIRSMDFLPFQIVNFLFLSLYVRQM